MQSSMFEGVCLVGFAVLAPCCVARLPAADDPPADGIRITVLDAGSEKPIDAFRVIAGVPAGSIAGEFEKRTGRAAVNWQPHTIRAGKDGELVWPLERAYEDTALRVEADGFQSQTVAWIKKADGPQHVIYRLALDQGVEGRVLQPNGEPAVGATLAVALPQRDAVLENGRLRGAGEPLPEKLSDAWRRPTMVQTDGEGRFRLPTELEPAAVLVVHESGVRELAFSALQAAPEISLQEWGRIEGRALWHDKPGANERVTLSIHRQDYGYPGMIACYGQTTTDENGSFVFDKLLPGQAQLSRPIEIAGQEGSGPSAAIFDGLYTHLDVQAGGSTPALIGGEGRRVTGRLTGRETWEGVTFHFHPTAPHVGFPGDESRWQAFGVFRESPIGPLFFSEELPVNADGTFEIARLLPGRYQFFVSAPGLNRYAASSEIRVDAETSGQAPAPLDLGEIPVSAIGEPR